MDASKLDIAISRLLDAKADCWVIQNGNIVYVGIITGFKSNPPEKFPFLINKSPELAKMEETRLKYTPTETKICTIITLSDAALVHRWASSMITDAYAQFSFVIGTKVGISIDRAWIKDFMFHPGKENCSLDFGIQHTSEIIYSKEQRHVNCK